MKLVSKAKTEKHGPYTSSDVEVNLPAHDTDVNLVFPNGKIVSLQWRVEGCSLDVCLPEEKHLVTCWEGGDMKPAITSARTRLRRKFLRTVMFAGAGSL